MYHIQMSVKIANIQGEIGQARLFVGLSRYVELKLGGGSSVCRVRT